MAPSAWTMIALTRDARRPGRARRPGPGARRRPPGSDTRPRRTQDAEPRRRRLACRWSNPNVANPLSEKGHRGLDGEVRGTGGEQLVVLGWLGDLAAPCARGGRPDAGGAALVGACGLGVPGGRPGGAARHGRGSSGHPALPPGPGAARVLTAGHAAPSVGHLQPWRFVVVDVQLRTRAARMADPERLAQAGQLDADSARHLLDLQLEGIREDRPTRRVRRTGSGSAAPQWED